jgi:hypothetical protein
MKIRKYKYKNVLVGKPEEKRPVGKRSVDKTLTQCVLNKYDGNMWTGFFWPMNGSLGYGNEASGSVKFP